MGAQGKGVLFTVEPAFPSMAAGKPLSNGLIYIFPQEFSTSTSILSYFPYCLGSE